MCTHNSSSALGVGNTAIVAPDPLVISLSEEKNSSLGGTSAFQNERDVEASTEDSPSRRPSLHYKRTHSALHGLMDQGIEIDFCGRDEAHTYLLLIGGRVELDLSKHESHSTLLSRNVAMVVRTPSQTAALPEEGHPDASEQNLTYPMDSTNTNNETTSRPARKRPPTLLKLPSQQSISPEGCGPATNSTTSSGRALSAHSAESPVEQPIEVLVVDDDQLTRTLMTRARNVLPARRLTSRSARKPPYAASPGAWESDPNPICSA